MTSSKMSIVGLPPFMIFHKVGAGEIELVQHLEIMHVSYTMNITVEYFITVIYCMILKVRTWQISCNLKENNSEYSCRIFSPHIAGEYCLQIFRPYIHILPLLRKLTSL